MVGCAAVSCSNTDLQFSLFRFPADERRKKVWLERMSRAGPWKCSSSSRLCEAHFDQSVICVGTRGGKPFKSLKADSLPSIFSHKVFQLHTLDPVVKPPPKRPKVDNDVAQAARVYREHNYRGIEDEDDIYMDQDSTGADPSVFQGGGEVDVQADENGVVLIEQEKDVFAIATVEEDRTGHSVSTISLEAVSDDAHECVVKNRALEKELGEIKCELSKVKEERDKLQADNDRLRAEVKDCVEVMKLMRGTFREDQMKWFQKGKSMRGHKWSDETLEEGLRWRHRFGSTAYGKFTEAFPFPNIRTLQKRTESIQFEPGILTQMIQALKGKVESDIPEMGRDVVVMWDEMSLTKGVQYAPGLQRWYGEVTLPEHEGIANKGLVFMLAGITVRFKQVLAYHYSNDVTDGNVYGPIVRNIVQHVEACKLRVRGTTMDMGSPNQKFWK